MSFLVGITLLQTFLAVVEKISGKNFELCTRNIEVVARIAN